MEIGLMFLHWQEQAIGQHGCDGALKLESQKLQKRRALAATEK
jgi:hypothetical protein